MPEADLVGAVLDGRYRVIEPIGHGAMGIVYRGERIKLGRAVAIKVLHDSLPHELAGRRRFELEARAMAQLEHPNCVAVLDVGLHEGRPYVVMDFVSGTDLRTLIGRDGRVEPARAVALVKQVLSGLAHAHELGIVHRDIKPANLMVGHKTGIGDQLKILDFGLARSLDPDAKKLTGGMVLGTPSYMAPEQCRGAAIDARTDLYAVGVLLFELLTGRKPFESAADDPVEVVGMHLHKAPPRLADIVPDVEWGELESVVARALAKTPDERYSTAAELAAALDAAIARNEETVPFEPLMMDDLLALGATPVPGPLPRPERSAPVPAAQSTGPTAPPAAPGSAPMPVVEPEPTGPTGPTPSGRLPRAQTPSVVVSPSATELSAPAPLAAVADEPSAPSDGSVTSVLPAPPPAAVPLPAPPPLFPARADSGGDPPAVQQRRMHIAAGVTGAVVVLAVILRACTGGETAPTGTGSGGAAPGDARAADASAIVVTAILPDAAPAPAPVDALEPRVIDAAAPPPKPDAGSAPAPDDPAGAALQQAATRVSAHDVDGALKILADAHRRFVANPDIPYMAGRLQIGKGRYADGLASLRSAIRLFPGYVDDPELPKLVVDAFMSTPTRHAELARFLHDDLGHAAVAPLTAARDRAATPALRARAAAELKRLH